MSAGVAAGLLRAGAGRARRLATAVALAGAAAAGDELPGVDAVADGESIRLTGGSVRARMRRGDWQLVAWIERVRAIAGGVR